MSMFHSSLTQMLEFIEKATSSAIHNSTFSDSMGGDLTTVDDALSTLFDEDDTRDSYLAFEVNLLNVHAKLLLKYLSNRHTHRNTSCER